jgi:hypothetical protein
MSSGAYKFLRPGAVGPFSGFSWPTPRGTRPGEWVESPIGNGPCRDGIHACERRHLPLWIWEELWEVELDGDVEPIRHKVRAPRGRLVRRVDAWSPVSAKSFAIACARRAAAHAAEPLRAVGHGDAAEALADGEDLAAVRALAADRWDRLPPEARIPLGMASDGVARAMTAEATTDAYVSAHGSAVCAYIAALTALRVAGSQALERERAWQADWLGDALGLDQVPRPQP